MKQEDVESLNDLVECPACGNIPFMAALAREAPFRCRCGYEFDEHPLEDYITEQRDVIDGESGGGDE